MKWEKHHNGEKFESDKSSPRSRSWLERLTALLAANHKNQDQLMELLRDAEERDILSSEMLGMMDRYYRSNTGKL